MSGASQALDLVLWRPTSQSSLTALTGTNAYTTTPFTEPQN